jgi:hypothetical protein
MKSVQDYIKVLENIENQDSEQAQINTVGDMIKVLSKFDSNMPIQMTMNMEYQGEVGFVTQEDGYVLISD